MELGNKKTGIMLVITGLWVLITLCAWKGQWFVSLIASVILMLLYMMLGAAKNGKLNMKFFVTTLLSWSILWAGGFFLSKYYADIFAGKMPDFTILGFHPSFAFTILTYWIGGMLTLTLGLTIFADLWLSDEDWNNFKDKIESLNSLKEEC
ncbi:hypothetical protein [uncultured Clostridium sp.]|uniref:hypothetical protein n=1 Tax=uncultured Clostridium sp. TaxID=59620 RepID=UPI0028E68610|nr:hypothetical protein [uncultured Clostridium sp.]